MLDPLKWWRDSKCAGDLFWEEGKGVSGLPARPDTYKWMRNVHAAFTLCSQRHSAKDDVPVLSRSVAIGTNNSCSGFTHCWFWADIACHQAYTQSWPYTQYPLYNRRERWRFRNRFVFFSGFALALKTAFLLISTLCEMHCGLQLIAQWSCCLPTHPWFTE